MMKIVKPTALLVCLSAFSGCVVYPDSYYTGNYPNNYPNNSPAQSGYSQTQYPQQPAPVFSAPPVQVISPLPVLGAALWIAGFWELIGGHYYWSPGHYSHGGGRYSHHGGGRR